MRTTAVPAPLRAAARRVGAAIVSSPAALTAVRLRWVILLALTAAQVAVDASGITSDVDLFRHAGERLISADWANTFADRDVQAGPGLLLGYGLLSRGAAAVGLPFDLTFSVVVHVGLTVLVVTAVRRACGVLELPMSELRELIAGLLLIALDVPGVCYLSGHPSEVVVVVLWCHALLDQLEGKAARAAVWITISALVVTQGAVGLVILLAARPVRRAVVTTAAAACAVIAVIGSFALFGVVRTQDFVWATSSTSLWGPILGAGHPFPWPARLAQGVAMGVVGLLVIASRPPTNITPWLVPATIMLARLLLDPTSFEYYWAGAQAVYVIGLCSLDPRSWRRDVPFYLAGYPILLHGLAPTVYAAGLALVALGWVAFSGTRGGPSAPAGHRGSVAK